jgi:hypothetical protein
MTMSRFILVVALRILAICSSHVPDAILAAIDSRSKRWALVIHEPTFGCRHGTDAIPGLDLKGYCPNPNDTFRRLILRSGRYRSFGEAHRWMEAKSRELLATGTLTGEYPAQWGRGVVGRRDRDA